MNRQIAGDKINPPQGMATFHTWQTQKIAALHLSSSNYQFLSPAHINSVSGQYLPLLQWSQRSENVGWEPLPSVELQLGCTVVYRGVYLALCLYQTQQGPCMPKCLSSLVRSPQPNKRCYLGLKFCLSHFIFYSPSCMEGNHLLGQWIWVCPSWGLITFLMPP